MMIIVFFQRVHMNVETGYLSNYREYVTVQVTYGNERGGSLGGEVPKSKV